MMASVANRAGSCVDPGAKRSISGSCDESPWMTTSSSKTQAGPKRYSSCNQRKNLPSTGYRSPAKISPKSLLVTSGAARTLARSRASSWMPAKGVLLGVCEGLGDAIGGNGVAVARTAGAGVAGETCAQSGANSIRLNARARHSVRLA